MVSGPHQFNCKEMGVSGNFLAVAYLAWLNILYFQTQSISWLVIWIKWINISRKKSSYVFSFIVFFRSQFWYNSGKSLDRKHSNPKLIVASRISMQQARERVRSKTPDWKDSRFFADFCFVQLKLDKVDDIYCPLKTHNIKF